MPKAKKRCDAVKTRRASLGLSALMFEAGTIMAIRTMMIGYNIAPAHERQRMIDEKQAVYSRAAFAAWNASAHGL